MRLYCLISGLRANPDGCSGVVGLLRDDDHGEDLDADGLVGSKGDSQPTPGPFPLNRVIDRTISGYGVGLFGSIPDHRELSAKVNEGEPLPGLLSKFVSLIETHFNVTRPCRWYGPGLEFLPSPPRCQLGKSR